MAEQRPDHEADQPETRAVLANERTLLAYQRTAIGLIVAALAFAHLLDGSRAVQILSVLLLVAGGVAAVGGWLRYRQVDADMRAGRPASPSATANLLTLAVVVCLVLAAVAVVAALG